MKGASFSGREVFILTRVLEGQDDVNYFVLFLSRKAKG